MLGFTLFEVQPNLPDRHCNLDRLCDGQAPLLHRHALGQIAWLVDVAATAPGQDGSDQGVAAREC